MKRPDFWLKKNILSLALWPLSKIYDLLVRSRFIFSSPHQVDVPVICVGNFTVGGGGKTPVVTTIVQILIQQGHRPYILSRGFGGIEQGPYLLQGNETSAQVGDEPLLLFRHAPVIVGADRQKSAALAIRSGATILVLDDGLQNPTLKKDLTLSVIDVVNGFGNGFVFPSGPLRASLCWQKKLADLVIFLAPDDFKHNHKSLIGFTCIKSMNASLVAANTTSVFKGQKALAFCGLAQPEKFKASLGLAGVEVVDFITFPDHHEYSARDAQNLISKAAERNLILLTTEKDYVRISTSPATRAQLAGLTNVFSVTCQFENNEEIQNLLKHYQPAVHGA